MVVDHNWSNSLSGQNFSTRTIVSSQPWEGMRHLRTYHAKRCGCQGCQNCGGLCPVEKVNGKLTHLHAVEDKILYDIVGQRNGVVFGLFLANPHGASMDTVIHRFYQRAKTDADRYLKQAVEELDYRGLPHPSSPMEAVTAELRYRGLLK